MTSDFHIEKDSANGHFLLQGVLDLYNAHKARELLENALGDNPGDGVIDLSQLTRLDTVGALLLAQFQQKYSLALERLRPQHAGLLTLVAQAQIAPPQRATPPAAWKRMVENVGEKVMSTYEWIIDIITFFGQACVTFLHSLASVKHLRLADIMHHIEETGINAIPIIGAMALMIAIVLAYQGIAQLRPLGAQNLTVNLVAISVLREMGVLLTAIMVAGRSGSAFAAEIGVMKAREEVDALKVMGIDPFEMLVMPRIIALIITLPLLTFIADMMGLLGGGVMSMALIHIPPGAYIERVRAVAHGDDFLVGMVKAPVFAFLIAMTGCMHGMKVSGSSESVGSETTASVVQAIFLVLAADALFSVLFEKIGI